MRRPAHKVEVFALAMVELDGKRSTADQSPTVETIEQRNLFDNSFGMFGYAFHMVSLER